MRWPVHGNVLEALREGRLEVGPHALLEPGVWITAPGQARVRIGEGTFLNLGVMVASIGAGGDRRALHARQRLLRHRRQPPLRRPRHADHLAGLHVEGARRASATTSGCGANVVVTSGVTIGERCVIGANSVVTTDIPAGSIAAGAPGPRAQADRVGGRRRLLRHDDLDAEDHRAEEHDGADEAEQRRRPSPPPPVPRWRFSPARVKPTSAVAKAPGDDEPGQRGRPHELEQLAEVDRGDHASAREDLAARDAAAEEGEHEAEDRQRHDQRAERAGAEDRADPVGERRR